MAITVAAMKRNTFTWGTFHSTSANYGIKLSSSQTGVIKVYGDDGGAQATGNIRTILGRALITVSHTGDLSVRGVMGQVKFSGALTTSTSTTAGVEGLLETSTTLTASGTVCAVKAVVNPGGALTNSLNLAGVISEMYSTASAGTGTPAFRALIHPSGTTKWPLAFLAKAADVAQGVQIGEFSSETAGSGLVLTSSVTRPNGFFGDDNGAAMTGDIRNVLSRVLLTTAHTGALSICGMRGHLKVKSATAEGGGSGTFAGTSGWFEPASTTTLTTAWFCGTEGALQINGTITNTSGYLFGVLGRLWDGGVAKTITDTNNACAALGAMGTNETKWPAALYISNCSAVAQFAAASDTYAHGIKAVAATPAGDTTHALKFLVAGTAVYVPGYAAETF